MNTVAISAILPTRDRPTALARMLESLWMQNILPSELIVVDGSTDSSSKQLVARYKDLCAPDCVITWTEASQLGAASQRNQGVAISTQPFICFLEDDIVFETNCLERLWRAIDGDIKLGGVSAMITNQRYLSPGLLSRTFFTVLAGRRQRNFAGRVVGPGMNLLPEDRDDLPEVVSVDWLNLGCTIYRREALPSPPFDSHFTGYSLMEDVALSLKVGKKWKLANARTARIFHDSQPADYKSDKSALAKMQLVNRHYLMTKVLGQDKLSDYAKLGLLEAFGVLTPLVQLSAWKALPAILWGKTCATMALLRTQGNESSESLLPENQRPVSPVEPARR